MPTALEKLGISSTPASIYIGGESRTTKGDAIAARSPIDGKTLATIASASAADVETTINAATEAFKKLREIPAPRRGEFVRRLGEKLRHHKAALAEIVQLEAGKITQEALGEVQEMIDICDFAVGLSRQLYGLTIASERPGHRMMEQWHPARSDRRHHRVQLSRRRLGVERRLGSRLRRSGRSGSRRKRRRSPRSPA